MLLGASNLGLSRTANLLSRSIAERHTNRFVPADRQAKVSRPEVRLIYQRVQSRGLLPSDDDSTRVHNSAFCKVSRTVFYGNQEYEWASI